MKNAKEARELAIKTRDNLIATELEKIEAQIDSAIKSGKTSTSYYQRMSIEAKQKLKDLGYDVKDQTSQRDGVIFIISW